MTHITPTEADREAALAIWHLCDDGPYCSLPEWLVQAFARHRLAAIEECAKVAETTYTESGWHPAAKNAGLGIAEAIRKLGSPS